MALTEKAKRHIYRWAGRTATRLVRTVGATSQRIVDPPDAHARLIAQHPAILAFWHGQFMMVADQLMIVADELPEGEHGAAMVGRHSDAEIIGEVVRNPRAALVRGAGAGNRTGDYGGASALRAALKVLASGKSMGMTADVFPEPPRRAGKGVVTLARLSGRPIMPLAIATSRFISFNTWSRMTINLPFSRLSFVVGEPIRVPKDAGPDELEAKRREVEDALNEVTRRAYGLAGADIRRATPALSKNGTDIYEKKFKPARGAAPQNGNLAEPLELLGDCLAIELGSPERLELRHRLFSDPAAWAALFNIAGENRLFGALAQRLTERSLIPPVPRIETASEQHPARIIAQAEEDNREFVADMKRQLSNVAILLNQLDVEPLLLKGAQPLWKNQLPWRTLVDLDLLVPKESAARVYQTLTQNGYRPQEWFVERSWSHHLPPLAPDGFEGLLEIHWQASNRYAEYFLHSDELWAESVADERDGARVRILADHMNLLHSFHHHHFGHRGDVRATISLKGLYEFVSGFVQLSEPALHQLASRTDRHIRVSAGLDLWIAAAHDLFRMPVRAPFEIQGDAMQIWKRMKRNGNRPDETRKYPGLRDTLALASDAGRLRRAGFAPSRSGRLQAQMSIISSILHPKFITATAPKIT